MQQERSLLPDGPVGLLVTIAGGGGGGGDPHAGAVAEVMNVDSSGTRLVVRGEELWSVQAALAYPVRDGIPVMLEHEARTLALDEVESGIRQMRQEADRAGAR